MKQIFSLVHKGKIEGWKGYLAAKFIPDFRFRGFLSDCGAESKLDVGTGLNLSQFVSYKLY